MAVRMLDEFTTVRTEGLLLPPELLQRIVDPDSGLDGRTPSDYHLSGERINEAISNAWNRARAAWRNFKAAQAMLPESDAGTTITRERWLLPLFTALDYGRLQTATAVTIDGRAYPISHRWGDLPIHLVSFRIDLDRRAPGVSGAAASSPHGLMQSFLNHSPEHTWGFVSNGYRLRVLRDNSSLTRQAYLEFNLEGMMEGEVYPDFVLFWMVCHQSRVEGNRADDYWLEKWARTADEQGKRALDQLRDSVEAAIRALGTGFIKHPRNRELREKLRSGALDRQDYYRQLLRLVYRLLFLFAAEDRELLLDPEADDNAQELYLKHYSVRRVREVAEHFRGTTHSDQFEGLRLVMRLVGGYDNGKAKILGLPVLGSALFDDKFVQDIIDCKIANRDLLEAIRALAFIQDRETGTLRPIDYKHLGPEELGGVYESLLELHPEVNLAAQRFELETAGGHDRKTTGSYFTPPALINALLDSALMPVLNEARQSRDPESAILALKICDPACGSGSFLIAAAHRIAHALAQVRAGGDEPSPALVRTALRQVIGNCIYGVDINPMSVELCKVNLWIEALDPGKPLSFLDHHIKVGNSLLGTTPALMARGIPDGAFEPLEGDDRALTAKLRKQNRSERKTLESGQLTMFDLFDLSANQAALTRAVSEVDEIEDIRIAGIRAKEAQWQALANDPEYIRAHLLADAWCAAFVWERRPDTGVPPLTQFVYQRLCQDPFASEFEPIRRIVVQLREQYGFFHWHIEFPGVFEVPAELDSAENEQCGWNGGFDCVLGNPPWERIKIQEKEWFAGRNPLIASAPNAAARKQMIDALIKNDPYLLQAFRADQRKAEGESHFARVSERYPLCGRGDVNTYTLFAENSRHILSGRGHMGLIVPSGIATDDTTRFFFQDLMQTRSLVSLYDFENREGLFPAVDSRMKFCLLTIAGSAAPAQQGATFVFFAQNVGDLDNPEKRFTLSAEDIRLLNPNTGTTATFRSKRDAEITKAIYRRVPVLIREEPLENPWGIRFATMFHMSNDSHLFCTREQLERRGFHLVGNRFVADDPADKRVYLPLYEAKMIHQFDHRWATYDGLETRDLTLAEKQDPTCVAMPRYWVAAEEVEARVGSTPYMIGFRDIARSTDERTAIMSLIANNAVGHKVPLIFVNNATSTHQNIAFFTNFNGLIFDYVSRQKVGGTSMTFFIVKQLTALPPDTYIPPLLDFIVPRSLELTYTAWDMQPFAQDVGYDGPPFIWNEDRRFLMRCELDALYFHLYQISRDDTDYIMETFPIVKRKDEAKFDEYRTKRVILEMYDQMAALPKVSVPHPKGEGQGEYLVPDVSQFRTWLTPPPADPSVAHG